MTSKIARFLSGLPVRRASPAAGTPAAAPPRTLPASWPVKPRPLARSMELGLWHWLLGSFPDHHVLPKVPLTRFTMPLSKRDGQEWFDLLSSTYCSFAVCDEYARVVGCVDILTTNGPSSRNRYLKQTLLLQCSIRYWVASPAELPDATAIRADFLGTVTEPGHDPFQSASMRLHEMLDRNRSQRSSQFGNLDSDMQVQPQPDSFLGTLDSLHTPL